MVRKAVIVAAGCGKRMGHVLERNTPKCLLRVGGETLIGRSIRFLREAGIYEIYVIGGYGFSSLSKALRETGVFLVYNPFYYTTNNIFSLWLALPFVLGDRFVYLHGDLLYQPSILKILLEYSSFDGIIDAALAVDFSAFLDSESMKVNCGSNGLLKYSGKDILLDEAHGEWIGVGLFHQTTFYYLYESVRTVLIKRRMNAYDAEAFSSLAQKRKVKCVAVDGNKWVEIDTLSDYVRAQHIFG